MSNDVAIVDGKSTGQKENQGRQTQTLQMHFGVPNIYTDRNGNILWTWRGPSSRHGSSESLDFH